MQEHPITSVLHLSPALAGLFALMMVPMTLAVALRRIRKKVQFLDGGDAILLRLVRAHANYVETVPMALIAMAAAEYCRAPAWMVGGGGLALACGRLMHYVTLVRSGVGIGRTLGMVLTLVPTVAFGAWSVMHFRW